MRGHSAAFVFALCIACGVAVAPARAAEPVGAPVKWDQARVTQYSVELTAAVEAAVQEMRKSPMQTTPGQRNVWFDLKEDLRLIENTATHLQSELQGGAGAEETRATFDRIETLRRDAQEHGRASMIPAPVMDALVKAGSVHNLMMPYYHGKR